MTPHFEAVTFDFWDTLFEVQGHRVVPRRTDAITALLADAGQPIERDRVQVLFEQVARTFDEHWRANRQYRFEDGLEFVLAGLDVGDADLAGAIRQTWLDVYAGADVVARPDAVSAIGRLTEAGVGLAVICDVSLIPSSVLSTYLDRAGLLDAFGVFAWSDEVGVYKPDSSIFRHALDGLGVTDAARACHVGDKRRTDVAGARAMGMTAVRYTGVVDDPEEADGPEADHVIDDHQDLLVIVGVA